MTPVEALQLALSKEIEAIETYQKFATEHKVAKDVFEFLVNEEQKHKQLLEKKIQELTR
jgi:rubrerythrin